MVPLPGNAAAIIDDLPRLFTKGGRDAMKGKKGAAYGAYRGVRQYGRYMQRPGASRLTGARLAMRNVGKYTSRGLKAGWGAATGGYMFLQLPMAMYETGQAEHGHKMSTFAGAALPFLGTGLATAAFGGLPGMLAGAVLDPLIKRTVTRGLQAVADFGRNSPQIGSRYQDTEVAYTMRQRGAQEMNGSLLNARQFLGREAALLHS